MKLICLAVFVEKTRNLKSIAKLADEKVKEVSLDDKIQGNTILKSSLVLLCGYLEGFIRESIEEYIDAINDLKVSTYQYPDAMLCTTIKDICSNISHNKPRTVEHFVKTFKEEIPIKLNKSKFSSMGGNPSVDNIESAFDIIGIPRIIDTLTIKDYGVSSTFTSESQIDKKLQIKISSALEKYGTNSPLTDITNAIDEKWQPKTRRRKVGYINEIENLLKKRNRIAHGEGDETITTNELMDFILCVENIFNGISEVLKSQYTRITNLITKDSCIKYMPRRIKVSIPSHQRYQASDNLPRYKSTQKSKNNKIKKELSTAQVL